MKHLVGQAGLEPATSWFVGRRKGAIGGSGRPLPHVFRPVFAIWDNPRKLRAATDCQSFVSHGRATGTLTDWPHVITICKYDDVRVGRCEEPGEPKEARPGFRRRSPRVRRTDIDVRRSEA